MPLELGEHPLDLLSSFVRDLRWIDLCQVELQLLSCLHGVTERAVASTEVVTELRVGFQLEGLLELAQGALVVPLLERRLTQSSVRARLSALGFVIGARCGLRTCELRSRRRNQHRKNREDG